MTIRINKTNVEGLPPTEGGKLSFYFDDKLTGFGVRVSGQTKTFIAQSYVKGQKVRVKIGRLGEIMPDGKELTAETARDAAKKLIGQMAGDEHPEEVEQRKEAQATTLREVFPEFVKSRQADKNGGLRPKTISTYESAINRCFGDWLDKPVSEITRAMINDRFEKIATTEGPRSREGGARAQAAQAMRVLSTLLSFASAKYDGALTDKDPFEKLSGLHRGWSKTAKRSDVIDPDDMKAWYTAVLGLSSKTMRDYILFCFFTGLRRTAAAKLTWSCYNPKSRIITVRAKDDKTNKEQRLPLPDFVCQILEQRRTNRPRKIDPSKDYIFPDDPTKSPNRKDPSKRTESGFIQEPKRAIATVVARSGVKFSMHTLRRTYHRQPTGHCLLQTESTTQSFCRVRCYRPKLRSS